MKLRNSLFALTIGILCSTSLQAQQVDEKESNSAIGIKGGLNISNLSIDDSDDKNLLYGFHAGLFNKIALSESFAIQPELLYAQKGLELDYDAAGVDGESKFKLHYIDLPVLMVFNLSRDLSINAGPYISYLAAASATTEADLFDSFDLDSEDEIDRDQFNSIDYGLSAGITFDLNPLLIGFDYNWGLRKVAKDDQAAEFLLGDAKNRVIRVSAGLKF